MKKNYLLAILFLFVLRVAGQNCNFGYQTNPGTTTVYFYGNQNFAPPLYHFVWNFGDNTPPDTGMYPTHTYNGVGPYVTCCDIFDTANVILCSSCDTISTHIVNCFFTYTNAGATFTFTAVNTTGNITWDFGDGTIGTGNTVTHTYLSGGQFSVIMTETDFLGAVTCQNGQGIVVPGNPGNCSFTVQVQNGLAVFTPVGVPGNVNITWMFGDGNSMMGVGPVTYQYSASGIYNACMLTVDSGGNQCLSCQNISVTFQAGNCFFTAAPDPADPSTYSFAAVPAYPMSVISWNFGDGFVSTGLNAQHTYAVAGTYTACMTEIDTSGDTCSSCQLITIQNTPLCSFTYNVSLLNPLTINFQANGANTITWDFGDGTTDTGASVIHTYAVGGVYQVCISTGTPGTANFCTTCDIISVGNVANYCNITFYPDPLNPNTFVFTSTQSSPSSMIAWDFGDNTVGTGQSVTHAYNASGTYVVCVVERDSAQNLVCQNCVTVQVNAGNGAACQASFLATSFGLDAYFIDMSIAQLAPVIYNWDFGDGSTSNAQFPQHTYAVPGVYNVCLSISDGNCTDTFCSPLLIDTNVFNPGNGCNAFYAIIQLAPYQVTVVNLSSGLNLSYDWDFGDGNHDTNPYPSHVYSSTGSYNLCLTVSDNNGCSSTYCDTLNVDTLGNIYRMAAPGFTLNVVSPAQLTGINEVDLSKSFSIYPNPFNTELHVIMKNGSVRPTGYRIFSIQGAVVSEGKLEGISGTINTASLSAGAYILEVKMNDGSAGYQRVIKN